MNMVQTGNYSAAGPLCEDLKLEKQTGLFTITPRNKDKP